MTYFGDVVEERENTIAPEMMTYGLKALRPVARAAT